jgi:hypothetical protein
MTRHANIAVALVASLVASGSARAADPASREPTIQLFLQVCATSYAHAELVETGVRLFGLREVFGESAEFYLRGAQGRVWAGIVESKRFAVALRPEVLCTVIAHDGSGPEIRAAVESWVPPPESGIAVKKDVVPSPANLESTSYELRGGKVRERWMITISSDPNSHTRAMLSWGPL